LKGLYQLVQFICKINPSNGPGDSKSSDFDTWINNLRSVGILVLGYVSTGYGTDSTKTIDITKAKIDKYASWYNLDGIFFDEMENSPGQEDYYRTASQYAKSKGYTMTIGNPGTDLDLVYDGIMDGIEIYEGDGIPDPMTLKNHVTG